MYCRAWERGTSALIGFGWGVGVCVGPARGWWRRGGGVVVGGAAVEGRRGAGSTLKATAKPVLIGTAVVGATTMIFSIVMALTEGLKPEIDKLSILHPPFLLRFRAG